MTLQIPSTTNQNERSTINLFNAHFMFITPNRKTRRNYNKENAKDIKRSLFYQEMIATIANVIYKGTSQCPF